MTPAPCAVEVSKMLLNFWESAKSKKYMDEVHFEPVFKRMSDTQENPLN